MFKQWDVDAHDTEGGGGSVDTEELAAVLEGPFTKAEARRRPRSVVVGATESRVAACGVWRRSPFTKAEAWRRPRSVVVG